MSIQYNLDDYLLDITKEFEWDLNVPPNFANVEFVKRAYMTAVYKIADEFEDGKYRDKILEEFTK